MAEPGETLHGNRRRAVAVLAGGALVVAAAVVLAVAPLLERPAGPAGSGEAQTVLISMAGFSPTRVRVSAGQPLTLTIVNPDSKFHTDGGWHQFAIDALHLDVRVPPHEQKTVVLRPLRAGRYEFYCDICCGGRSNPSMIGVLEVRG